MKLDYLFKDTTWTIQEDLTLYLLQNPFMKELKINFMSYKKLIDSLGHNVIYEDRTDMDFKNVPRSEITRGILFVGPYDYCFVYPIPEDHIDNPAICMINKDNT